MLTLNRGDSMVENSRSTDLYLLSETFDTISKAKDFQVIADIIFNFIKKIYKIGYGSHIQDK